MKFDIPVHTRIATHREKFLPTYMPAPPDFMRSQRLIAAEKNWSVALEHLNRSSRFGMDNLLVRNLKVIVLRKLNHQTEAEEFLCQTLASRFAR